MALRILLDTDAFCKLAAGELLRDAVGLFGADLTQCGRLPALPYMLQRGRMRSLYGPELCDALIPVAGEVPVMDSPSDAWLDRLTPIQGIDPGEAQILALAAETGLFVMTGDKRALRALKDVGEFIQPLAGNIVVLEEILLALCDYLGVDEVRRRVEPVAVADTMIQICFSAGNADPQVALQSYYDSLVAELQPLVLWDYRGGGEA